MFLNRKKYTFIGGCYPLPATPCNGNYKVDIANMYASGYAADHAIKLLERIHGRSRSACIVGGCVRDIIMGKIPHDVDIATNMTPGELKKLFGETKSNNGEAHGTVLVPYDGIMYEVTRFRADGTYSDGRHPDYVEWADTFEEDSRRRDFTVNAMGIDHKGRLLDYHGGLTDICNKVIRTVGNPVDRFTEDPLRIIRAFRFSAVLGFSIEKETLDATSALSDHLMSVHAERMHDELNKVIDTGNPYAFAEFISSIAANVSDKVLKHFFGMTSNELDAVVETIKQASFLDWNHTVAYMFMFHNVRDTKNVMSALKCTRNEIDPVLRYNHLLDFREKHQNVLDNIVEWVDMVAGTDAYVLSFYQMRHDGRCPVSLPMYNFLETADNASQYNTRKCSEYIASLGKYSGKEFGNALRRVRKAMYLHQLTRVDDFTDEDARIALEKD